MIYWQLGKELLITYRKYRPDLENIYRQLLSNLETTWRTFLDNLETSHRQLVIYVEALNVKEMRFQVSRYYSYFKLHQNLEIIWQPVDKLIDLLEILAAYEGKIWNFSEL